MAVPKLDGVEIKDRKSLKGLFCSVLEVSGLSYGGTGFGDAEVPPVREAVQALHSVLSSSLVTAHEEHSQLPCLGANEENALILESSGERLNVIFGDTLSFGVEGLSVLQPSHVLAVKLFLTEQVGHSQWLEFEDSLALLCSSHWSLSAIEEGT